MAVCTSSKLHLSLPLDKCSSAKAKSSGPLRGCKPSFSTSSAFKFGKRKAHVRREFFIFVAESPVDAVEKDQNGGFAVATEKNSHHALENGFLPTSDDSFVPEMKDVPVSVKRVLFNYGFQAKFLRKGPTVPGSVFKLAFENFGREWTALRRSYLFGDLEKISKSKVEGGPLGMVSSYLGHGFITFLRGLDKLLQVYDGLPELKEEKKVVDTELDELQQALKKLTLSNDAVWERERNRPPVEAPWWILGPYYVLCWMLDVIFENRPIQRFWFLETVARMPYFSYISMLHLYETLGWWRVGAEVRKVHFAEEWNEMHHLKIMESLGGDLEWRDRFFGQHAAFFYYWILNFMFLISPKVAYNFSELIEMHAVDTYGQFVDENEKFLKTLPPPPVAVEYYEGEDLYMYDEFQTSSLPETRRPKMDNLYDVFNAIAGDEYEHVKTMVACQNLDTVIVSPHKAKVTSGTP